jgi:hypothetical protein
MRWFVEIAPIGHAGAPEHWVVEATQWQPALQAARALRGDPGVLTGFSIELLDDGYRAVDPATRTRYVIRQAPDGTPLSQGNGPIPSTAVDPTAAAPRDELVTKPDVASAKRASSSLSETAVLGSGSVPRSEGRLKVPRPSPGGSTGTARSAGAQASGGSDLAATKKSEVGDSLPALEPLYRKEQAPTDESPLLYCECAWVVAEGTAEEQIVRALMVRFEELARACATAKPGKLFKLAVFDHRFERKPSRPPLVALTWKDWKGENPEIQFLRRATNGAAEKAAPHAAPASFPQPTPASEAATKPDLPALSLSTPATEPAPPKPASEPSTATLPGTGSASTAGQAAAAPAQTPSQAPSSPSVAPAPISNPWATPAHGVVSRISTVPPGSQRRPYVPGPRSQHPRAGRPSADELIGTLFEIMHDLHFVQDVIEGAEFILAMALDKLQSDVGFVHLYDINKREFVVVRAAGPGADKVLLQRTNEKEPLVAAAMRRKRAVVVGDATTDERLTSDRWTQIGEPIRSVICAPVEQAGRFLGLLELANPKDKAPFREVEGNALTYIGEQFAEFVASRGILLDPDRIRAR